MPSQPLARQDGRLAVRERGLAIQAFPDYLHTAVAMHALDFVLLQLVMRGRCLHLMGEDRHHDGPGALGIIHYHQLHDLVTPHGPVDVINVYVDLRRYPLPRLPDPLQAVLPVIIPLHPAFGHRLNRMVHLQLPSLATVAPLLHGMLAEQASAAPGAADAMDAYFRLFLIACCRAALDQGIKPALSPRIHAAPSLERVRRHIGRHFPDRLTVDDLVKVAGMSRSHLCRTFRDYTGVPLITYVIQRRLEHAMLLLRGTDDKIAAIAYASGFDDLSYFNRTFRRVVGCTPGDFRRRLIATTRG